MAVVRVRGPLKSLAGGRSDHELEGEPGENFRVSARAFAGEPVEYALRDSRSGRLLASVASAFYGPKIWWAEDATGEWTQADGVALPEGGEKALERIWVIVRGED